MRLSPEQISQIHSVLKHYWGSTSYKLYLYGSRAQNHLRGGDIDLLIVTDQAGENIFSEKELEILVQIKKQPAIGQRRIDLKAVTEDTFKTEPFFIAVSGDCIEI